MVELHLVRTTPMKPKRKALLSEEPKTASIKIPREWHRILKFIHANEGIEITDIVVEAFEKAGLRERAEKARL